MNMDELIVMSKSRGELPLTIICHPYLFALKEGGDISKDLLDYSLLLLQRNCSEIIRKEGDYKKM
ncbi:MAG: hypothetical protein H0X51_04680 [Parachlamydiaceae bacterium]|nr:hypothetical protein [Parachlamydiaceae bacterium]